MNFNNKHILILPVIFISLFYGIFTGLIKMGWEFPAELNFSEHGAIMVGSFIGTLISLERSLTLKNKIALLVPLVNSLSIIFFLLKLNYIAYYFLLIGAIGLIIIYYTIYVKYKTFYTLIMLAGALCYFIGNAVLIKSAFYPSAVMWWFAFIFFTIAAERIELTKFTLAKNANKKIFVLIIMLMLFIAGILIPFHSSGGYIIGISLIGSVIWFMKYDIIKVSIKKTGQFFYSALLLLTGYIWLIITGIFFIYGVYFGLFYDSALHSFFIGFVFQMIFAHAPLILPIVLKLNLNSVNLFSKSLYIWYVLLNLSLALRILSSIDIIPLPKLYFGFASGISIIGFFINIRFLFHYRTRSVIN
jgi:hypothetical protein